MLDSWPAFGNGPLAAVNFNDAASRRAAWDRFRKYAYQWY